jgi:hypothetical protein
MSAPSTGLSKAERRALSAATSSPSSWKGRSILPTEFNGRVTLTLPELAQLLRVSRWSIYQAALRGDFAIITIGKRKLVPRRVVEDLLTSGNSEPAE